MMLPQDEAKVLVLYSGGTIGMLNTDAGYVPEKGYLTRYLRSQTRFHDPFGESLFSNSSSSATFRSWEAATQSPISSRPLSPVAGPSEPNHTLKVLASNTDGEGYSEKWEESLMTPPIGKDGRRIRYCILEYFPLLDSSNMSMTDWIRLATDIELNYHSFDGFIILHGTDTMPYTSSALSFLLEDLGKTVIVTGAQIPLGELRNDAVDNILGSLLLAGGYVIPEVSLFFGYQLLRGNRSRKVSSLEFEAFQSPNLESLAKVGINIDVDWSLVTRPTKLKSFRAHKKMNPNVAILQLFPGIPATTVHTFLSPPMQGIVLETFGAGNAPERADLMMAIREACVRGVVIVNISQCPRGSVSPVYAGGKALADAGVVPGADMTPECALTKLSYLLSKSLPTPLIRELMATPLRGELSLPNLSTRAPSDAHAASFSSLVGHLLTLASPETMGTTIPPFRETKSEDAASWSRTEQDTHLVEAMLLPYLLSLAAGKDDTTTLTQLLARMEEVDAFRPRSLNSRAAKSVAGLVNTIDAASGRTALQTAAIRGSEGCLGVLLGAGALVHLRDTLGHTALYYAARAGHASCVTLLRQAGAHLGGSDVEGGYVALAWKAADEDGRDVWRAAGAEV